MRGKCREANELMGTSGRQVWRLNEEECEGQKYSRKYAMRLPLKNAHVTHCSFDGMRKKRIYSKAKKDIGI